MPTIVDVPAGVHGSKYLDTTEIDETVKLLKEHPDKFIGDIVPAMDTRVKARYAAAQVRKALLETHNVATRARIYTIKDDSTGAELHTFALRLKADTEPEPAKVEGEDEVAAKRGKHEKAAA